MLRQTLHGNWKREVNPCGERCTRTVAGLDLNQHVAACWHDHFRAREDKSSTGGNGTLIHYRSSYKQGKSACFAEIRNALGILGEYA